MHRSASSASLTSHQRCLLCSTSVYSNATTTRRDGECSGRTAHVPHQERDVEVLGCQLTARPAGAPFSHCPWERPAGVADADRMPVVVDIPPHALISTDELRIGLRAWRGGDSLPSPVSLGMVPEFGGWFARTIRGWLFGRTTCRRAGASGSTSRAVAFSASQMTVWRAGSPPRSGRPISVCFARLCV